jgi:hypothetical protein
LSGDSRDPNPTDINVQFFMKTNQTDPFLAPISWGTGTIIPLQLVLSRKIFKKVTNRIFPIQNAKISAWLLEKLRLFTSEGSLEG